MTTVKMIPGFKDKKALSAFLQERLKIQKEFNQKLMDLKQEKETILKDHEEKVLCSILMDSSTYVRLSTDALNNFYSDCESLYSVESGIVLKEIQIIFCECSIELSLTSSLRIKFIFEKEEFNNYYASFLFDRLYFNDKDFEISDQSMGPCIDPKFIDSEKYFIAKNFLIDIQNIFKEIQEKK